MRAQPDSTGRYADEWHSKRTQHVENDGGDCVNSRTCARIFTFWFAGFVLNAQAALDSAAKVREKAASGTNSLGVAPGYALTEIPYSGTPLVWVNDRTVLFVGAPISISKKPSPPGVTAEILLYRWNTSTSEVVPITKAGAYPKLC